MPTSLQRNVLNSQVNLSSWSVKHIGGRQSDGTTKRARAKSGSDHNSVSCEGRNGNKSSISSPTMMARKSLWVTCHPLTLKWVRRGQDFPSKLKSANNGNCSRPTKLRWVKCWRELSGYIKDFSKLVSLSQLASNDILKLRINFSRSGERLAIVDISFGLGTESGNPMTVLSSLKLSSNTQFKNTQISTMSSRS